MASSAFLFSASLHLRLTHWQLEVTGRKIKTLDRPAEAAESEDSSLEYMFNRLHIASSAHWEYWFSRSSGDLNARSSWIRLRRSSSRISSSESESPSTPPSTLRYLDPELRAIPSADVAERRAPLDGPVPVQEPEIAGAVLDSDSDGLGEALVVGGCRESDDLFFRM